MYKYVITVLLQAGPWFLSGSASSHIGERNFAHQAWPCELLLLSVSWELKNLGFSWGAWKNKHYWQAISQHDIISNMIKLYIQVPLGLKVTFCPRSAVSTLTSGHPLIQVTPFFLQHQRSLWQLW